MFSKAIESVGRMLGLGHGRTAEEEDRRVWGRIACDLQTTCRHAGHADAADVTVRVRNVSAGGIGLSVGRAFTPGALLSIALPGSDDGEPTYVLACVVRCDPAGEAGRFEMGCTFAGVLDDEDLARFGARRARPGPEDKRQWVRYGCRARVSYQVVRTPAPSEIAEARVRDISAGGVSLEVADDLSVGDLLSLDLRDGEEFVLTTLASVVRAETGPSGARVVGCNFIRELPEETLERLA